jgi:uncharacterized protein YcgL (UPF0745 family)
MSPPTTIPCIVYRASRKDEMYLYVHKDRKLEDIPEALRALTGRLEPVMELELSDRRPLARVDVAQVMRQLADQGFFLQMPPDPIRPWLREGE